MQDEHRQFQEVDRTHPADDKKTETSKHSKTTPPATAGQTLKRTWPTEKDPSGETEPKHTLVTKNSSTVDRWLGESMREQPWHNISGIPELSPSKGRFVIKGETGSNSALAGSEQRKSSEVDK
ncbi:hypothetical protein MMC28_006391 [Mycoblastus sanguinarius]|nr:hypothetical protein [Mycoblastus sanguinarius]